MLSIFRTSPFRLLALFGIFTLGVSTTQLYERDASTGYGTITTVTNGSVVRATINNPPINLYDYKLIIDLYAFLNSLSIPNAPKVVIFDSANPEWFIAHLDLNLLRTDSPPQNASQLLGIYGETVLLLASLPVIFVGQVSGRAFGAGNELLVQLDMRFAGPGTHLGSLEVGIGLTHGNGGIQYLTKLIGRGRASEYLLSSGDVDAQTAAAIGWVNRAYATVPELHDGVDALAQRIATFPQGALNATKAGINENKPSTQSLANDLTRFVGLQGTPEAQAAIRKFLELSHNQTLSPFELGLDQDLVDLYT